MPAFSFKSQFIPKIEEGTKGGTIRKYGKRPPVREGQPLMLYYAMRTKWCKKIKDGTCVELWHVIIKATSIKLSRGAVTFTLDERTSLSELHQFAVSDGFADWWDMKEYWRDEGFPFDGFHARWIPLKEQVNVTY